MLKHAQKTLVKYGARGAVTVQGLVFAWFFTVFAALYVEPCSENYVKCGAQGAVTVQGLVFALFLQCLRLFMLRHVQKTV